MYVIVRNATFCKFTYEKFLPAFYFFDLVKIRIRVMCRNVVVVRNATLGKFTYENFTQSFYCRMLKIGLKNGEIRFPHPDWPVPYWHTVKNVKKGRNVKKRENRVFGMSGRWEIVKNG